MSSVMFLAREGIGDKLSPHVTGNEKYLTPPTPTACTFDVHVVLWCSIMVSHLAQDKGLYSYQY
jgi:hypothetical protein